MSDISITNPNPPLEEVLEHYGIKGMKWGVRRTKEELSKAGSAVFDKHHISAGATAAHVVLTGPLALGTVPLHNILKAQKKAGRKSKISIGEAALHIVLTGPLALGTIPAHKAFKQRKK